MLKVVGILASIVATAVPLAPVAFGDKQGRTTSLHDNFALSRPSVTITTLIDGARRELAHNILRNFERQIYAGHIELLVLDQSSTGPSALLTESSKKGSTSNRKTRYLFRNTAEEASLNTGTARNYLLVRSQGDVTVIMDSDDFYFPGYVDYMVRGLLQQQALWIGLNGFHCASITTDKIDGYGFSWNMDRRVDTASDEPDIPTVGFGVAFYTFLRGWLRFMPWQTTEEMGFGNLLANKVGLIDSTYLVIDGGDGLRYLVWINTHLPHVCVPGYTALLLYRLPAHNRGTSRAGTGVGPRRTARAASRTRC
jgi:glycosyltransferase involved in cell wall biosynthesis